MTLILTTPSEVADLIAQRAKDIRLSLNLSQRSLAARSGVSLSVIKKFERTGKISLNSLLMIALPLDCLMEFLNLFNSKSPENAAKSGKLMTLDDLLKDQTRKRGRT